MGVDTGRMESEAMMRSKRLSPELHDLLTEVVHQKCPDLLAALDPDPLSIPKKDRYRIAQALSDEFCATGLCPDSEPNGRGIQIEDLIDHIWTRPLIEEPEEEPFE